MITVFADAHVHIHPAHDVQHVIGAARARALEYGGPFVLFLADEWPARTLARLDDAGQVDGRAMITDAGLGRALSWSDHRPGVLFVAGRQLVSRERLEVLALALPDGHPLAATPRGQRPARDLVADAIGAGALAVLPWGVGKWLGPRGALVQRLAQDVELRTSRRVFLGDIAHRCWPWRPPAAIAPGLQVLPGTDPLPLPGQEARVGTYGFALDVEWDPASPASRVVGALANGAAVRPIGAREAPLRVAIDQVRYRLRRS